MDTKAANPGVLSAFNATLAETIAEDLILLCQISSGPEKDNLFDRFCDQWVAFYGSTVPRTVKPLLNPSNGMNLVFQFMRYAIRTDFDPVRFWGVG
jgi:hypothetical protein